MKKEFLLSHTFIFIAIIIALALLSIAIIHPSQSSQENPPPELDLELQVGSTNGITILAFIISGVILLPLITSGALKREKKSLQE